MKINNKEVLQSYILTTAKYDYSVYEKRILYKIIEQLQFLIEGKELNQNYSLKEFLHDDIKLFKFTFPFSAFKKNEEDKNHAQIKKALLSLAKKVNASSFATAILSVATPFSISHSGKIAFEKDRIVLLIANQ